MHRAAHIVVLAVVLAALCACGHRARVIPENKLVRIYHDMFLADQWVRDHPDARTEVDTMLIFDPIFHRYGYTFADYDRTVHYYLDHNDDYVKLLNRVEKQLRKEGEGLQLEADALTAREVELNKFRRAFQEKDFSTDSLRWAGVNALWPVVLPPTDTLPPVDTLAQADSTAQADTLKATLLPDAERARFQKNARGLEERIKELTD